MSTILPPKRIPLGVDNFKQLVDVRYNYLFIDKTLFIQELFDNRCFYFSDAKKNFNYTLKVKIKQI